MPEPDVPPEPMARADESRLNAIDRWIVDLRGRTHELANKLTIALGVLERIETHLTTTSGQVTALQLWRAGREVQSEASEKAITALDGKLEKAVAALDAKIDAGSKKTADNDARLIRIEASVSLLKWMIPVGVAAAGVITGVLVKLL